MSMNTATNRARAGSMPPLQLHRAMPIDFANSEAEVETIDEASRDVLDITWVAYLLIAALLAASCAGIGFIAGRYFS